MLQVAPMASPSLALEQQISANTIAAQAVDADLEVRAQARLTWGAAFLNHAPASLAS
jgi:hypothetical protein